MSNRQRLIDGFLKAKGWGEAKQTALMPDASKRSYIRLQQGDRKAILMNVPPEADENIPAFLSITEMLRERSLSAPDVLAHDIDDGFVLLEDLGDALFARLCETDEVDEIDLYSAAVDALVEKDKIKLDRRFPDYSQPVYLREASLLPDWYLVHSEQAVSEQARAEFDALVAQMTSNLHRSTPVLVLRDYHAENLLWLPQREGTARVGLLDYQDGLAGHPAYDLVSLLEDARRDTSTVLRAEMKSRFIQASGLDQLTFDRDYAILGAQRNLKIIGIFARLCIRDKKQHYVDLIPRVWKHLQNDLSHPELVSLRKWVSEHVGAPEPHVLNLIKAAANA